MLQEGPSGAAGGGVRWESWEEAGAGTWAGEGEGQTRAERGSRGGSERIDLRDVPEAAMTEQGDCLALGLEGPGVQDRVQSPAGGGVQGGAVPAMGLERSSKYGGDAVAREEFWETVSRREGLLALQDLGSELLGGLRLGR